MQYFRKRHGRTCIAFLYQPFGLEKCSFSKRKSCSQFLTLGNESIAVTLLTAVNISCSVLYCRFNSITPRPDYTLYFVLQETILRGTLLIGEHC